MLKEQLLEDFKNAMKEKNELKKNTIMMIRSAILQIEKDTQKELGENELKKRKETLADIEKSGRNDLISEVNDEIAIIKAYLPAELTKEEIQKIVEDAVKEAGATSIKDMGKVMQIAKTKTAGRADNKLLSDIVRSMLA